VDTGLPARTSQPRQRFARGHGHILASNTARLGLVLAGHAAGFDCSGGRCHRSAHRHATSRNRSSSVRRIASAPLWRSDICEAGRDDHRARFATSGWRRCVGIEFPSNATGISHRTSIADVAATETGNIASIKAKTDNLDVALSTRAMESGGNLASIKTNTDKLDVALSTVATARQDTGNATLASILADLALLLQTQGGTATGISGPMIQGVVNDAPPAQLDGTLAPLSLNSEGRLRVALEQPVASFFTDSMFGSSCAWGASGF
jgi:hypothetical protein